MGRNVKRLYSEFKPKHYILELTPKKLRQMQFAAEMWVSNSDWQGEYQLAAMGIDSEQFTFIDVL